MNAEYMVYDKLDHELFRGEGTVDRISYFLNIPVEEINEFIVERKQSSNRMLLRKRYMFRAVKGD